MKTKRKKINSKSKTIKKKYYDKKLSKLSKSKITHILYNFKKEDIINDYEKLKEISCDNINSNSKYGSDFVNYFTAIERLDTKGRTGYSCFDIIQNFNEFYNNKYYFHNAINSTFKNKFFTFDTEKKVKSLKSIFSLYMGNVGIFRPILAKNIICEFKPKKCWILLWDGVDD